MSDDLLRVYFDPAEIGPDGYPFVWHRGQPDIPEAEGYQPGFDAIKDYIREQAGHRCERCGHPYRKGQGLNDGWSACDEHCTHGSPIRSRDGYVIEAQWRILTVHHLNGVKHDCRWWNLASLCQRCHLTIQAKVYLDRPYDREHTPWFRPHAAGYYASDGKILAPGEPPGREPSREYVLAHLDEILALHATQGSLL